MTQIPIPAGVATTFATNRAAATRVAITSNSLYRQLLTSLETIAEPELWALMEAAVYSLRQRDTLTRSIKECGTVECFGDKWPGDFDFLPSQSEALSLVEAIADQFSNRQLHTCWQSLLTKSNRTQKLALIEAITYAQHYSSTVRQALEECQLSDLFSEFLEHLDVWMSEPEALQMIRLLSGSLLAQSSETLPNVGDGRDDR
ncbi:MULTISPECIES: hypothetical protein [unclassified Microcoleus]|uniref:hypothetical protein n=1 Tax=unclassified Microcoleus TaxID=2642155 RepID=UPI001DBD41C1|nr:MULTISPECIES: hypothetical protein [unclassified Microcoleus]MCC3595797.1 hypothetical protein [Microcoleus sp. PH2017_26_ELK_O_A]MCC3620599.1 hypothetical protein [Microcoleus sp. PH2017_36_ELK_O_B]